MLDTDPTAQALLPSCAAVPDGYGRGPSVSPAAATDFAAAGRRNLAGTPPA